MTSIDTDSINSESESEQEIEASKLIDGADTTMVHTYSIIGLIIFYVMIAVVIILRFRD